MTTDRDELRAVRNKELSGEGIANASLLSEMGAKAKGNVDEMVAMLIHVERLIVLTDRTLRVAQPPVNGKLGIRWWVKQARDRIRMPTLVTWHQRRGERWRARRLKRLQRDRIFREGSAALCADNAYALAQAGAKLIGEYEGLRSELECVLRNLVRANRAFKRVNALQARVILEHGQVIEKLTGAGYAVDAKTRGLVDKYLE